MYSVLCPVAVSIGSSIMQNVRLTLKACGDVTITKPQTTYRTVEQEPNKCYEVTIPDVYCEEEKCILAKVTAPSDPDLNEATTFALFTCRVEYFDVLCSKPNEGEVRGEVVRNNTLPQPVTSDYVDEIELHKMRCEVAESLSRANSMAGAGNIGAARQLLNDATVRIQGSRVAFRPLAVHLLYTVQESLGGLKDEVWNASMDVQSVYTCSYTYSYGWKDSATHASMVFTFCILLSFISILSVT